MLSRAPLRTWFATAIVVLACHAGSQDLRQLTRDNMLFVQVRLGSSPAVAFALDSGASSIVVDRRFAREIHLPLGASSVRSGAGSDRCQVRDLNVDIQAEDIPLRSHPIAADLSGISSYFGQDLHGIAGGEIFRSNVVAINVASHTVQLQHPETLRRQTNDIRIPLETRDLLCCIVNSMITAGQKQFRARLLIDTGAPGIGVVIGPKVAKQYNLLAGNHSEPIEVPGLCAKTRLVRLADGVVLQLASTHTIAALAYVSVDDTGSFVSGGFDGIIGGQVLRQLGTVIFNAPEREIILRSDR